MIGEEQFNQSKPTAVFINGARNMVDEGDGTGTKEGKIWARIDVYEEQYIAGLLSWPTWKFAPRGIRQWKTVLPCRKNVSHRGYYRNLPDEGELGGGSAPGVSEQDYNDDRNTYISKRCG